MSNTEPQNIKPETLVLDACSVSKSYRQGKTEYAVLHEVDLAVRRGEFLAVMGPSGSGKSTLLHILGLMSTPTRAKRLTIDGVEATWLNQARRTILRRDKIGFVFQRFNLLTVLNAADNLGVALRLRGLHDDHHLDRVLDFVALTEKRDFKPGQMSIGEQQRLAFARAIVHRPTILLADEPTGNLDTDNADKLMTLIRQAQTEFGQTIVMVTHNADLAAQADRVCLMTDGKLTNGRVD